MIIMMMQTNKTSCACCPLCLSVLLNIRRLCNQSKHLPVSLQGGISGPAATPWCFRNPTLTFRLVLVEPWKIVYRHALTKFVYLPLCVRSVRIRLIYWLRCLKQSGQCMLFPWHTLAWWLMKHTARSCAGYWRAALGQPPRQWNGIKGRQSVAPPPR